MFLQFSMCQREVPDIVSLPKCFVDALETFFGKFCEANSKMMKVDAYQSLWRHTSIFMVSRVNRFYLVPVIQRVTKIHLLCIKKNRERYDFSSIYILPYYRLLQRQFNMAKQLFKNATINNIKSLLQSGSTTPLTNLKNFPSTCAVNQEAHNQYARLELQFYDFHEALSKFNLIAKICSQFGYTPEMFNVYNRIILKLYTPQADDKVLTLKDLYLSYLIDGLHSQNVETAHESAIEKLKSLE